MESEKKSREIWKAPFFRFQNQPFGVHDLTSLEPQHLPIGDVGAPNANSKLPKWKEKH